MLKERGTVILIKLVVSDIDGTLLKEGTNVVNPDLFKVIRKLKKRGIMFAAASGRQYCSMRTLFKPVEDDMIFICENGAQVMCRKYTISIVPMDLQESKALILYIRDIPGCELAISTKKYMYVESKDPEYIHMLTAGYEYAIKTVSDVTKINEEILKVAIFKKEGAQSIEARVRDRWSGKFNVLMSGKCWLDLMDYKTDKSYAVKSIQEYMHIKNSEIMAFGDNHNDIKMLRLAGESYAMKKAGNDVKNAAKYIAPDSEDNGVLQTISNVILD